MDHFTLAELQKIDIADELKISPLRTDGISYGTPTWIWSVIVNGALFGLLAFSVINEYCRMQTV